MAPRAAMLPAPPPPPPPSPPAAPGPGPAAAAAGDAALAGLTPEERSRFDGLGPGKRAEIRGLLDRGMIEAARSELRRGKAPPPPPPLATLDDAVRALETHGRADPGLLPKVTEGLRVEIGDHPGSWRYLHQQLGRVAAGEVPAAVMLEALGRWRDRMARGRPIEKPAAYFTRTLREKVRRHEGGPDA